MKQDLIVLKKKWRTSSVYLYALLQRLTSLQSLITNSSFNYITICDSGSTLHSVVQDKIAKGSDWKLLNAWTADSKRSQTTNKNFIFCIINRSTSTQKGQNRRERSPILIPDQSYRWIVNTGSGKSELRRTKGWSIKQSWRARGKNWS